MSWIRQSAPSPKQILWGLLAGILVCSGLVGFAYARTAIPSPSAIASAQTTTLYYSDGKTKITTIGTTNRTDVPLKQVPEAVQYAVLAAEDRHFYSEPGISPTGIVRALLVDIKGGDITQGGSTITQQYAKNAYLSDQRSLTRKLKEIFIATKLGQTRSKNSILSDYLNTIYFGRDAYGIQSAAKAYFRRGVAKLTVAQGAFLAAIIRGPSLYDPKSATDDAQQKAVALTAVTARWHYVIAGMVSEGWLAQSQAQELRFPKVRAPRSNSSQCRGQECFIKLAVEHELTTVDGISQAQLDLGGYKIVTTINKTNEDAMVAAEDAVLPKNNRGTPESGAVSIVPDDGAIRAMYGGPKYCGHQKKDKDACIDLSGYDGFFARPAGSSFKLFTLLAALKKGISLSSTFDGPPTVDVDGASISNSSPGESCYNCSLVRAFAESINTIFVPLAKQVGPSKVVDAAYAAGIPTSRKLPEVPDIALGPADVAPLELANAYATVAANGTRSTPYLVQSVKTNSGQEIYRANPDAGKTSGVFSKAVTADATYAMTKVLAAGGTAYGHALSGRPAAGKTGTVGNESTGENVDAWFTGFTPQLCTSVWIGNVDRSAAIGGGVGEVFGGTLPATIWQQTMNGALTGESVEQFPAPPDIGTVEHSANPTSSPSPTATQTVTAKPTHSPSTGPSGGPTTSPSTSPSGGPTATPSISPTVSTTPTSVKTHKAHPR